MAPKVCAKHLGVVFVLLCAGYARMPLRNPKPIHVRVRFLACADPIAVSTTYLNKRVCQAEVHDGKDTSAARVVYQWMSYQQPLPNEFVDPDIEHKFTAVRDKECDGPADTDDVSLTQRPSTLTRSQDSPRLRCYLIGPDGYYSSFTRDGRRVHPY